MTMKNFSSEDLQKKLRSKNNNKLLFIIILKVINCLEGGENKYKKIFWIWFIWWVKNIRTELKEPSRISVVLPILWMRYYGLISPLLFKNSNFVSSFLQVIPFTLFIVRLLRFLGTGITDLLAVFLQTGYLNIGDMSCEWTEVFILNRRCISFYLPKQNSPFFKFLVLELELALVKLKFTLIPQSEVWMWC